VFALAECVRGWIQGRGWVDYATWQPRHDTATGILRLVTNNWWISLNITHQYPCRHFHRGRLSVTKAPVSSSPALPHALLASTMPSGRTAAADWKLNPSTHITSSNRHQESRLPPADWLNILKEEDFPT